MNITFIGATGMLGKPVALELAAAGFKITAVVRDLAKAKSQLPAAINLVQGDVKDIAALTAAFKGTGAVYLNLSVTQTEKETAFHAELDGLKNILQAAKAAGAGRIVYLSSLIKDYTGFEWWVFRIKNDAVKMIKASGIPYTIFYPSAFMETMHRQNVQGSKLLLAGASPQKMYWISASDYGKQVAASLNRGGSENYDYAVQGPEALSMDEAAARFIKSYKTPLTVARAPLGLLKFIGIFSAKLNYGSHILEALANYPEVFQSKKTWDDLGKPLTTIDDFAKSL